MVFLEDAVTRRLRIRNPHLKEWKIAEHDSMSPALAGEERIHKFD
jgi:hypothetical protein